MSHEPTERNPYRPGVGTRPVVLAGRGAELKRFGATLRAAPEIPANVRMTGLRGVGKSVLLREFALVGENSNWAVEQLEIEPRHNTTNGIVDLVGQTCTRAREKISRSARVKKKLGKAAETVGKVGISYGDLTFNFDPALSSVSVDVAKELFDTVELALAQGRNGFALLLDEAQVLRDESAGKSEHPLSLLIAAVSGLQRAEVPLAVVLCGLPTLAANLLKARTYTERMFRGEEISSLNSSDATEAFVEPLKETSMTADEKLTREVLEAVEGYPYFIQLWGAELWDAANEAGEVRLTVDLLKEVEPDIYRRLDIDFYEPRIQTLTPAEQDILIAAAHCIYPPLIVADLNDASDKSPGNVNVLLGRLVEAGVLYRPRKGQYEYTAPKFYEFLIRRNAKVKPEHQKKFKVGGADNTQLHLGG